MDQEQENSQVIGAIKIKDGLFIGDEFASKDLEFIVSNKVTHIVNCSGQQLPNLWESIGVSYLTFPWLENDQQVLFDPSDQNLNMIFSFIEQSVEQGESTLVHSLQGQSRSCCVLAAYIMKKFRWTLYKTLEFLNSRRPDLEIRASFFHQLTALEQKLARQGEGARSASWQEISDEQCAHETGELLVRNTFINAKNAPVADIFSDPTANYKAMLKDQRAKLRWRDSGLNDRSKLHIQEIPYETKEIDFRMSSKLAASKRDVLRSALKGSKNKVIINTASSSSASASVSSQEMRLSQQTRQSSAPPRQTYSQTSQPQENVQPSPGSSLRKPLTPSNLPNRSNNSQNSNNSVKGSISSGLKETNNRQGQGIQQDQGSSQSYPSEAQPPFGVQKQQQQGLQVPGVNVINESYKSPVLNDSSKPPAPATAASSQFGRQAASRQVPIPVGGSCLSSDAGSAKPQQQQQQGFSSSTSSGNTTKSSGIIHRSSSASNFEKEISYTQSATTALQEASKSKTPTRQLQEKYQIQQQQQQQLQADQRQQQPTSSSSIFQVNQYQDNSTYSHQQQLKQLPYKNTAEASSSIEITKQRSVSSVAAAASTTSAAFAPSTSSSSVAAAAAPFKQQYSQKIQPVQQLKEQQPQQKQLQNANTATQSRANCNSQPRARQCLDSNLSNSSMQAVLQEVEARRPQSASAKDKKEYSFVSSSSADVAQQGQQSPFHHQHHFHQQQQHLRIELPSKLSSQQLIQTRPQTTMSISSNSLNSSIGKKDNNNNNSNHLLTGIPLNPHFINPHKAYQRGESPSIKQKEKKVQKQHQLRMQQQQQFDAMQGSSQQQQQQGASLQSYQLNQGIQQQEQQQQQQQSKSPYPLSKSASAHSNNAQLPPQVPRFEMAQQNENIRPSSSASFQQSQAMISNAKRPPSAPTNNNSNTQSNNKPIYQPQQILREQDNNRSSLTPQVHEQLNQINQISSNLMKTLLHFSSPSSQQQQQQQQQSQSQPFSIQAQGSASALLLQPQSQQQSAQFSSSIKSSGNSQGFIKSSGGPIRATGDALQHSSGAIRSQIQRQDQGNIKRNNSGNDLNEAQMHYHHHQNNNSSSSSNDNPQGFPLNQFDRFSKSTKSTGQQQQQQPYQQQQSFQIPQPFNSQYSQQSSSSQAQQQQQQRTSSSAANGIAPPRSSSPQVAGKQNAMLSAQEAGQANQQVFQHSDKNGLDIYLLEQQQQQQQHRISAFQRAQETQKLQQQLRRSSPSQNAALNASCINSSQQQQHCYPNLLANNQLLEDSSFVSSNSSKPKWKL